MYKVLVVLLIISLGSSSVFSATKYYYTSYFNSDGSLKESLRESACARENGYIINDQFPQWNSGQEVVVYFSDKMPTNEEIQSESDRNKRESLRIRRKKLYNYRVFVKKYAEYWESFANIDFKFQINKDFDYLNEEHLRTVGIVIAFAPKTMKQLSEHGVAGRSQVGQVSRFRYLSRVCNGMVTEPFKIVQTMSFYSLSPRVIIHEFGHALGLAHEIEHGQIDPRDPVHNWVGQECENPENCLQYKKVTPGVDTNSIMHSSNSNNALFGDNNGLTGKPYISLMDRISISRMYPGKKSEAQIRREFSVNEEKNSARNINWFHFMNLLVKPNFTQTSKNVFQSTENSICQILGPNSSNNFSMIPTGVLNNCPGDQYQVVRKISNDGVQPYWISLADPTCDYQSDNSCASHYRGEVACYDERRFAVKSFLYFRGTCSDPALKPKSINLFYGEEYLPDYETFLRFDDSSYKKSDNS